MAIQVRRGANADFDASKMLPGELAVTTDGSRKAYVAFQAGDVKELASKEDVQEIVDNFDKNVEQEIEDAKNAVIEEAEEQVQKVINKAYEVLESIPDDYEELAKQSDEAVRTKADAILCTASGKSIVVKDSSNDYVRNLKPYGKTKQRTTTGKNKLPYPYNGTTKTEAGITFTDNGDGTITANGTATGNVYFYCIVSSSHYMDGKLSLLPTVSGVDIGIRTTDNTYVIGSGNEYSGYIDQLFIRILQGTTVSNIVFEPMIVSNETTDYEWEIYTGGLPSPSMEYPQELENVGEWGNLLDLSDSKVESTATKVMNEDGSATVTNNTSAAIAGLYKVLTGLLPKGTYTFRNWLGSTAYVMLSSSDYTHSVSTNGGNYTFDYDGESYLKIQYTDIGANSTVTFKAQITKASDNITPYRPYSGQMELESGVYGGNLLPNVNAETKKGITVTKNEDGSFILNGTSTENIDFRSDDVWLPTGIYTLSNVETIPLYTWLSMSNEPPLMIKGSYGVTKKTGKTIAGKKYFKFYINSGVTFNNFVLRPKLELGTEATPYEPYTPKQSHINLLGEGLPGIPLGQTIPDVIANSPIHMAGVYWDEETQQYWIGDTVDNESGERTVRCYEEEVVTKKQEHTNQYGYRYTAILTHNAITYICLCNIAQCEQNAGGGAINGVRISTSSGKSVVLGVESDEDEITMKIQYILAEPYTVPLTAGEIESYRALRSNYHVTTVVNDCGANMEFGYNADTKCYIDNKFAELAEKLLA